MPERKKTKPNPVQETVIGQPVQKPKGGAEKLRTGTKIASSYAILEEFFQMVGNPSLEFFADQEENFDPERLYPVTFTEEDARKIVELFTKRGDVVLDPFLGNGTTALVCSRTERKCVGIELYPYWIRVAKSKIDLACNGIKFVQGNCLTELQNFKTGSVDLVLTAPPCWEIASKLVLSPSRSTGTDQVLPAKRLRFVDRYASFLDRLEKLFAELFRVLKNDRFLCVTVSDFKHDGRYHMYHADIARRLEMCGFFLYELIALPNPERNGVALCEPTSAFSLNVRDQFVIVAYKHKMSGMIMRNWFNPYRRKDTATGE